MYVVGTYGLVVLAHYRGLLEKAGPHLSPKPLTGRLTYLESWVTKRKSTQASLVADFGGFDSCVSPRKVWGDGEEKVCCRPDPRGLYFDSLVEGTFALSLSPRRSISQNTVGRSN